MLVISVSPNSRITTIPIETSHSGEDVVIGSSSLQNSFIKTSQVGLEAIELLNQGCSLAETENILSKQCKQNISIKDLIKILYEANLISSIDDRRVNIGFKIQERSAANLINISNIVFSKQAYWMYLLLFVVAIIMNTHRLLSIQQLSYSASLFAIQHPIFTIFIAWILVMKHELFHYLAAVSLGMPAKIKIGSRYIFIVLETQSDGMNLVESRKRYRFYFAGILGDLLTIVVLLYLNNVLAYLDVGIDPRLIDLLVLQTVAGIIFQFDLFFKTDLYFAISDYFGKDNLYTNSGILFKSWFSGTNFSEDLESDTAVIVFALGRLFNYLLISILLVLSIYLTLTHRQLFEHTDVAIDWNMQYIYGLVYFILLSMIKIKNRKNQKDYTIVFSQQGGISEK